MIIHIKLHSKILRKIYVVVVEISSCKNSAFWCVFRWPTRLYGRLAYKPRYARNTVCMCMLDGENVAISVVASMLFNAVEMRHVGQRKIFKTRSMG
jgi:hypothetical protein